VENTCHSLGCAGFQTPQLKVFGKMGKISCQSALYLGESFHTSCSAITKHNRRTDVLSHNVVKHTGTQDCSSCSSMLGRDESGQHGFISITLSTSLEQQRISLCAGNDRRVPSPSLQTTSSMSLRLSLSQSDAIFLHTACELLTTWPRS